MHAPSDDREGAPGVPRRAAHRGAERCIETAGVLSLSVQCEEFPYKYVTVEGTVVRSDRPPSAEQMLAIAGRYRPEDAAQGFVEAELGYSEPGPVHFTVRPDRWLTFSFAKEDES